VAYYEHDKTSALTVLLARLQGEIADRADGMGSTIRSRALAAVDRLAVAKGRSFSNTPHVAQNEAITSTGRHRHSAIDGRTTRHDGYGMSQSCRAMTECIFGWGKQHGTMRKTKHRGIAAVAADFLLNFIAYNLVRIPKLVTR